ncbi:sulfatase [Microbacterium sp. Au-Mic1]|uniref:sulfatase n=1 Tax=Microbacterium sp. Au-Mic1 TaxID=2906457 RepID=UPI001E548C63|nr:sulfatase [Microbacterium sp. Au-Mic1]MCE4026249.1 sulfatase [Microbacterium sp. Au-Mic1]
MNGHRPNIVLILVDDLGWVDVSYSGSTFYETPHIDALATRGLRFSQAYAAAPVCSPSRAALMSGKYPARVGITNWIGGHTVGSLSDVPYFHGLPINEYSLAAALRDGGYRTWHVGKWHLGDGQCGPEAHGFEVIIGGGAQGSPSTYFSPYSLPPLADGPDGEYLTDRLTDEAVALITEYDGDAPFFLNLWHYGVHTPIQAPEHLVAHFRQKAQRLGIDTEAIEEGEAFPAWHVRGVRVRRRTMQSDPTYAAMVASLDASVGRVMEALRRTGRLDNTLIVFTSDNGGLATAEGSPTCNAPLAEGKGWMEDGGVRVPLAISWPRKLRPGDTDLLTTTPDLYPTLLAAAQVDGDSRQHVDGVDILALVEQSAPDRGPIFWHYPHYSNQGGTPGAAVREGRWKLIRWFEDGHEALYDLENDIGESIDLADEHAEIRIHLAGLLDAWSVDVQALVPRTNPMWAPEMHRRGFEKPPWNGIPT